MSSVPSTPDAARILTFPPIYGGLAVHTRNDPQGLLPWLRRIRTTKNYILEWNNTNRCLQVWYWPCINNQRVPPSELAALRQTHNYRHPSCLCASESMDASAHTEAAVFLVTRGPLTGEYVAACSRSQCKYWVFIERFYNRRGLLIQNIERHAPGVEVQVAPIEEPLPSTDDEANSSSPVPSSPLGRRSTSTYPQSPGPVSLARTRIRRRLDAITEGVPVAEPRPRPTDTLSLLMLLDAHTGAGISAGEFRQLFTKCKLCHLFTTDRVFARHNCIATPGASSSAPVEIIDLTKSD